MSMKYLAFILLYSNHLAIGQNQILDEKFCLGNTGGIMYSLGFGLNNGYYVVTSRDSFSFQNQFYKTANPNTFTNFIINRTRNDSSSAELVALGAFNYWEIARENGTTYYNSILDSGNYTFGTEYVAVSGKRNAIVIPVGNGKIQKPFELFTVANTPEGYYGYLVTLISDGNSLISTFAVAGSVSIGGQVIHNDEKMTGFYIARYSFNGSLMGIEKLAESSHVIHNSKLNKSGDGFIASFTFYDSLFIDGDTLLNITPLNQTAADLMVVSISTSLKKEWHKVLRSQGEDSDLYSFSTARKNVWICAFISAGKFWFGNKELVKDKPLNALTLIRTNRQGDIENALEINGLTSSTIIHQAFESDTTVLLSVSFPSDTVKIDRKPYAFKGRNYGAVYFRLYNSGNSELIGGLECNGSYACNGIMDWLPDDKMYSLVVNTDQKIFKFLNKVYTTDCPWAAKNYGRYMVFENLSNGLESPNQPDINFSLYPNPANGYFSWNIDNNMPVLAVELYDMQGKLIRALTQEEIEAKTADIRAIASGIYLVKIMTSSGVGTSKLIVK